MLDELAAGGCTISSSDPAAIPIVRYDREMRTWLPYEYQAQGGGLNGWTHGMYVSNLLMRLRSTLDTTAPLLPTEIYVRRL